MGEGWVPPAREEKIKYNATIRMQDLREHIIQDLKNKYPKNLSEQDYYEIADQAIDRILELGEIQAVHQSMNLYGPHIAKEVLIETRGSLVSKLGRGRP